MVSMLEIYNEQQQQQLHPPTENKYRIIINTFEFSLFFFFTANCNDLVANGSKAMAPARIQAAASFLAGCRNIYISCKMSISMFAIY
jgi:hypothetical protein